MTTFHFIRHGEVDNPHNVYYGRLPGFPLSNDGQRCIEYTAQRLTEYPIAAVYHSPLLRTSQSAKIIAKTLRSPAEPDERLIEVASFFEGKSRGNETRIHHYPPIKAGYAETMVEIYERMAEFLREKAEIHPGNHVVAVTHAGPIRILEVGLLGKPFTDEIYEEEEVPICGTDTIVTINGPIISVKRAELL